MDAPSTWMIRKKKENSSTITTSAEISASYHSITPCPGSWAASISRFAFAIRYTPHSLLDFLLLYHTALPPKRGRV